MYVCLEIFFNIIRKIPFKIVIVFFRHYSIAMNENISNFTFNVQEMDFHFAYYNKQTLCLKDISQGTWFIYVNITTTNIHKVSKELKNIQLKFDSNFIVALNQEDHITLWELYKIGPTLPIQRNNIGHWTDSEGLKFTKIHKWYRRSNLFGYNFEITTLVEAPYITKIKVDSKTGEFNMEGSYADLLNLYAKTLNFTYTYMPPPDNAWGSLQNDGTWNGMVGLAQREIVDFCK